MIQLAECSESTLRERATAAEAERDAYKLAANIGVQTQEMLLRALEIATDLLQRQAVEITALRENLSAAEDAFEAIIIEDVTDLIDASVPDPDPAAN